MYSDGLTARSALVMFSFVTRLLRCSFARLARKSRGDLEAANAIVMVSLVFDSAVGTSLVNVSECFLCEEYR